ncbi:MAG: NAD(P)-dependent oxidoreductase, partial [Sphingomicrobium sp.]
DVIGVDLRAAPTVAVQADCGDVAQWGPALGAVDAIVHVAALHAPHIGTRSDAEFQRTNVEATARLLDHAHRIGARHFVLTSTTSLYGYALASPTEAVWVDERLEPEPRDIYDVTKLEAERMTAAAGSPLTTTILRMSRCFPEPAAKMTAYRLYRGVDRRDVAEAHALAVESAAGPSRTFIVSTTSPFRRGDCADLLHDAPSVLARRSPGLIERMVARGLSPPLSIDRVYDAGMAARELGFRARFGIEACLAGDWDPAPSD